MGDSMSSISILGDTSGSVVLQAPAVSGSTTITMPAATGTMMVSGNIPAFYVYPTVGTSCANNAQTKVQFNTELYDTNNCFASNTFTPNVAGYYQFTAGINFSSVSFVQLALRKNGSDLIYGSYPNATSNTNVYVNSSFFAYANGTTDYFEIYVYQASGGTITNQVNAAYTFWSGYLARAA
jgi:hypothetical protein